MREVEVRLFPFRQLQGRSVRMFERLKSRVDALTAVIGPLDYQRQFIAGGALTRALLSVDPEAEGGDLDLFVVDGGGAVRVLEALKANGAEETNEDSSSGDRFKLRFRAAGLVDIIQATRPAGETIARFDLRVSALATDGKTILAVRGAMYDLRHRHAFPLRPTRADRVQRYVRDHRLDVSPGAPELDVDRIAEGIDGWTVPSGTTWETIMGRTEEITVRGPVEDITLITGRTV